MIMEKINFNDLMVDCTSKGKKIKKNDYLEVGDYPIIDQGKNLIAGYTDNEDGLFDEVPAIIFGDHTRIIKYIDEPFFLGADGVKVLRCKKKNPNYKYLYYVLKNAHIPDTGYNRHFKWLKESNLVYPETMEQEKIVNILDSISKIIEDRNKQLEELDTLIKSRFVEMFGDSFTNSKKLPELMWKDVFSTTTGKLDSNAMVEDGKYPFFTCAKESFWINEYAFDCEALLLAGNNAAGVYDVKYYNGKFNAYQRTYVLQLQNDNWSYTLFKQQLEDKLIHLKSQSKGTNTRYLTMGILNDLRFIIPEVEEQRQYAEFVNHIDKLKLEVQKSLDETQILFDSLMQKYFE